VRRDFRASPLLGTYFFILFPSLLQVAAAPRPHRATHRLQRDAAQLERLWLRRAPLGIPDVEARDVKLKGFLSLSVEAMPSITNCCFVMAMSQTSHVSPSAGPPQNLGMLLYGRRPS
jgi:hypothetical protein